jgi:two-component system, NtrC family, sensor kinase
MKRLLSIILLVSVCSNVVGQALPSHVQAAYNTAKTDSEKGKCLTAYLNSLQYDTAYTTTVNALNAYFDNQHDLVGQDYVQLHTCKGLFVNGDYISVLKLSLQLLERFKKRADGYGIYMAYAQIGEAYLYSKDFEQANAYSKKIMAIGELTNDKEMLSIAYNKLGTSYEQAGKPDSGLVYAKLAVKYAEETGNDNVKTFPLGTLAECYIGLKEYDKAMLYLNQSRDYAIKTNDQEALSWALQDYARLYLETNQQDSARYYGYQAIKQSSSIGFRYMVMFSYQYLYMSYEKTATKDSAYKYFRLWAFAKDSLLNSTKMKGLQLINFTNQLQQQEAEQEQRRLKNKLIMYAMLAGLSLSFIIGLILYRNNRQKQKANAVLQEKNEEIQSTLSRLKATQTQLIQSEKLASLGELTAGISHEIQNPLNFVTNFSELSIDLVKDLKDEMGKSPLTPEGGMIISLKDKEYIEELFSDLSANQEKIKHHGKRASSIVKGMLEHSRSNVGDKALTDINNLADEYLRLSFHGLRAKDKSFNADFKTDFEKDLPQIKLMQQDFGRVILNLINNAFYAVNQRRLNVGEVQNLTDVGTYSPTVTVSTQYVDNQIIIRIADNGTGMSESVKAKIFQPFFSTKPTGEGTGLGLSLANDIVTKGHGGTLKVESTEGVGTEFIIQLPLTP